jgi:hypothetical protein
MRTSGIRGVATLGWGTHLCRFYRDTAELQSLGLSYLLAGLQESEYGLWVTASPAQQDEALAAIPQATPEGPTFIERQQVEVLSYTDWYVRDGVFNRQAVLQQWRQKAEEVARRGFAGLRIIGDSAWLRTPQDRAEFLAYEQEVHSVIQGQHMLALCAYPANACEPHEMQQVFESHSAALFRNPKAGDVWMSMAVGNGGEIVE